MNLSTTNLKYLLVKFLSYTAAEIVESYKNNGETGIFNVTCKKSSYIFLYF